MKDKFTYFVTSLILNYWINRTTNWIMEWFNNTIQTVKRVAKWFKNVEYFKAMIYLKIWRIIVSLTSNGKLL